jgi:hypothetical protein
MLSVLASLVGVGTSSSDQRQAPRNSGLSCECRHTVVNNGMGSERVRAHLDDVVELHCTQVDRLDLRHFLPRPNALATGVR